MMMTNGETKKYVRVVGTKIGILGDVKIITQKDLSDLDEANCYMKKKSKKHDIIWTIIPQSIRVHA